MNDLIFIDVYFDISCSFHNKKKGPGITQSDLLIVNKTDLAPIIGADLDVMARDAKKMRYKYEYNMKRRIFFFTNISLIQR